MGEGKIVGEAVLIVLISLAFSIKKKLVNFSREKIVTSFPRAKIATNSCLVLCLVSRDALNSRDSNANCTCLSIF